MRGRWEHVTNASGAGYANLTRGDLGGRFQ